VWKDGKHLQTILKDGEGNASLWEAVKGGYDAFKSEAGIKQTMETAASLRGVDTKRHGDVTHISRETLNRWAQEYLDTKQSGGA